MTSRRPLTKREVETLLASCEGPSATVLEEITVVRQALLAPLSRLAGASDGNHTDWTDLIGCAATIGGWPDPRRDVLIAAAQPDAHPDPEAVLDALWDLVRELNENRSL